MKKPTATASITVSAAVAATLTGYVAACETAQPVAESKVCSDAGKSLCVPESTPPSDMNDPDPEQNGSEGNAMTADGARILPLSGMGISSTVATACLQTATVARCDDVSDSDRRSLESVQGPEDPHSHGEDNDENRSDAVPPVSNMINNSAAAWEHDRAMHMAAALQSTLFRPSIAPLLTSPPFVPASNSHLSHAVVIGERHKRDLDATNYAVQANLAFCNGKTAAFG